MAGEGAVPGERARPDGTATDARELQGGEARPPSAAESLWGQDVVSERQELLREAEKIAHFGSWAWDLATGHVAWSDELYAILGKDPASDQASFDNFMASIHADDRHYVYALSQRAVAGEVPERADFRVVRPDGSLREVTGLAQIFRGPDRAPRRMVGTIMDITDARRAERAMHRAVAHLKDAQRLAGLGSWTSDLETGESEWSEELFCLLAVPPDTRPGFDVFVERLHPDDRPLLRTLRDRLLRDGVAASCDCRIVWPSGEVRTVLMEARMDAGAGRIVGTLMDVTKQTQLERQLAQAQKMEALGRISGGVAHDFNNLLTIILLNVQSLMHEHKDERLERVHEAATHGASLTSQLTAFSRQQVVPRAAALDVNDVARAALELARGVLPDEVETRLAISERRAVVIADEAQMHQVLLNLIVNARDAMPSGGTLEVTTAIVDAPEGAADLAVRADRYVQLSVCDTGTGMDEAVRTRIFEPFFTTKGAGEGSGLGLATVFGIVAQSGGILRVDSKPGEGSTFHVFLPLAEASSVRPREPAAELPELRGSETLLVVEDDPGVRATLCAVLSASGYEVLQAARPSRVLELWQDHGVRIELLVSDVAMPEMNGVELAVRLRLEAPALPVLFVTGHPPAAGLDAVPGARWLAKPFTSTELLTTVRALLRTRP